ncbi:unnamed protein product, partial [Pleuronectes platessa]
MRLRYRRRGLANFLGPAASAATMLSRLHACGSSGETTGAGVCYRPSDSDLDAKADGFESALRSRQTPGSTALRGGGGKFPCRWRVYVAALLAVRARVQVFSQEESVMYGFGGGARR